MKKIFALLFAFTLISAFLISCSKDENNPSTPSNYVTILGEFSIGDKTFTNHTFDLDTPTELEGYLTSNVAKLPVYNAIRIENEGIDIGNNMVFNFDLEINSASVGDNVSMYADISIIQNNSIPAKQSTSLYIYSESATANITRIGDVGDYIEGTFEGDFNYSTKVVPPFHVKGKFKVKRVLEPLK